VLSIPPVLTLFLNLVLLSLMGFSVEEEWGTGHLVRFYAISTMTTALVAAWFHTPLMGSFFINFTLLFAYAALNRDQTFYLSTVLPIRVTFLAWLALAALLTGVFFGSKSNLAALAGAAAGFLYFASQRVRVIALAPRGEPSVQERFDAEDAAVAAATKNLARVAAVKKALSTASPSDIGRLIDLAERETVRGVNICPPVDFKPEHPDRYCIRCEGFAECTARHLRLNRPPSIIAPAQVEPAS
jgi:hypothetical protein